MTNRERLISLVGFAPAKESVDGELLEAGIDGTEDYNTGNSVILKRSAIRLMQLLLSTADQRNENGFDIKYDRKSLMELLNEYKTDVGDLVKKEGTLRNKSFMW